MQPADQNKEETEDGDVRFMDGRHVWLLARHVQHQLVVVAGARGVACRAGLMPWRRRRVPLLARELTNHEQGCRAMPRSGLGHRWKRDGLLTDGGADTDAATGFRKSTKFQSLSRGSADLQRHPNQRMRMTASAGACS